MIDEATLVRWFLFAIAAGAVAYGIWHFLKRMPPGRQHTLFPAERR